MDTKEKKEQLMSIISSKLTPLIDNNYVYLDLPYYNNLGDTLIWEGTKNFLKTLPYKCLYSTDMLFYIERNFSENVIILLQGGGNFGDLYRDHTDFRKRIINTYPRNKIIILPQSVYYNNSNLIQEDATFYANYPNVIICARDEYSYQFLKQNFSNNILLVPDMAFFIDLNKYKIPKSGVKSLYLKRLDKEFSSINYLKIPSEVEVHDWPTIEYSIKKYYYIDKIFYPVKFLFWIFGKKYKKLVEDFKRDKFYRPSYVQIGINFISQYSTIYTTRLHVLILSVLLDKKIFLMDNTTGKLNSFYTTWLKDLDNIIGN